ncbi:MAG: cell division protein ZapD [gamma proteobacterium symbiont of Taylorina sp.]|nr:cell division protein ZapD [gamma proteobacterium symbiont of Taylorina sp.]
MNNTDKITDSSIYELPLNERVRTLLRLEFLFHQARYSMRGYSVWDSRATISALLDITNIMTRIDLRSELINELERQTSSLLAISSRPGVDSSILDATLKKLDTYTKTLRASKSSNNDELNNNDLLKLIRQRESIPGGTCDFDIPIYHFWLEQEAEDRIYQLESWLKELDTFRLSITLILDLLRESAINTPLTAEQGFYQQSLDKTIPFQLVRVFLTSNTNYYAEISGGKHRFSIRFMKPVDNERPISCTEDIDFELSCCAL